MYLSVFPNGSSLLEMLLKYDVKADKENEGVEAIKNL